MGAAACLLVIAYLSLGSLLQLLTRELATGLSLTAIFCNPAFGFAGVGFPLLAMGAFARFWGALLPLRWYIQILFDQAVRGLPASSSAEPFIILGALAAVFFGLSWLRLSAIARTATRRISEPAPAPAFAGVGVGDAMFAEMRRILNDRGVFGLIVMAPVLYGVLYPQPYLGQLLRQIPIAVVDQDHTEVSRDLVEALNADEAVTVAVRADTLADAHAALARREVFAIVGIPKDTEREVLKGNKARLAAYVDFGLFSSVQPHARGHLRSERRRHRGNCRARSANRWQPCARGCDPRLSGRTVVATAVQSDRRLCELCRSRSFHTDPAADAVLRDRQLGRRGLRAGRKTWAGGSGRGRAPSSAKRWRIFASPCPGSLCI